MVYINWVCSPVFQCHLVSAIQQMGFGGTEIFLMAFSYLSTKGVIGVRLMHSRACYNSEKQTLKQLETYNFSSKLFCAFVLFLQACITRLGSLCAMRVLTLPRGPQLSSKGPGEVTQGSLFYPCAVSAIFVLAVPAMMEEVLINGDGEHSYVSPLFLCNMRGSE